jgi:hypothetical protein
MLVPMDTDKMVEDEGYPRPNFKPFSLTTPWLGFVMAWSLSCSVGVAVLVALGDKRPPSFHFHSNISYVSWVYAPTIISSLTTTFFRPIFFSYLRFSPYISMANIPDKQLANPEKFARMAKQLNPMAGGFPGLDFQERLILSFAMQSAVLLTQVKSGFLQPVQDAAGWNIEVSSGTGIAIVIMYFALFFATLMLLVRLKISSTGLRWSPCSLAAQVSLVQGSDIFPAFSGLDIIHVANRIKGRLRESAEEYGALRLGYWMREGSGIHWHGIAFLPSPRVREALDPTTATKGDLSQKSQSFANRGTQQKPNTDGHQTGKTTAGSHRSLDPRPASDDIDRIVSAHPGGDNNGNTSRKNEKTTLKGSISTLPISNC